MCSQDIENTVGKLGKLHTCDSHVTSTTSGRCWSEVDKQLNRMLIYNMPTHSQKRGIHARMLVSKCTSGLPIPPDVRDVEGNTEVKCNLSLENREFSSNDWMAPFQEELWIDVTSVCVSIGGVVTTIPLLPERKHTAVPNMFPSDSDDETDKEDLSAFGL